MNVTPERDDGVENIILWEDNDEEIKRLTSLMVSAMQDQAHVLGTLAVTSARVHAMALHLQKLIKEASCG